jgi:transposase
MVEHLKALAQTEGAEHIAFAYEASCQGFGLYDELVEAGIDCHVIAPTKLKRSPHQAKNKTDEKDARDVFKELRNHVMSEDEHEDFPAVWVPDHQTRADRELVRMRLRVGEELASCKTQVHAWLKVHSLRKPEGMHNWTQDHRRWLTRVAKMPQPGLQPSAQQALQSLLRQLVSWEQEAKTLEREIGELAQTPRYAEPVAALTAEMGIGVLSAMVFLTEMGDLSRFHNRRQIGAYLGLVPSQHESGQVDDRKGHITRQGSPRLRKILCQAVWARIAFHEPTREEFDEIKRRSPSRKKIMVVAHMRKLAIRLWHKGLDAQVQAGSFDPDAAPRR